MSHLFTFDGHGTYSPDGKVEVSAAEAQLRNAQQTEAELAHWAMKPETFCPAYYEFPNHGTAGQIYRASFYPSNTGAKVSTWMGAKLGDIISARVYQHNFGARMVSMRVRGTNGVTYFGRASWDNGSVIRLRKVKG